MEKKEKNYTLLHQCGSATEGSDMQNEKEKKNPTLLHESLSAAEPSDMEKEKGKEKELTIPHELIIEILLKLPVRSLLRFKCVCKSWFFLISDTQFAKSHFDLNAAPVHRLLLLRNEDQVESFDPESSLDERSTVLTLDVPPPPGSGWSSPDSDWSSPCENLLHFLGSCRGFILLGYERSGDIMVWNPTTRFHQHVDYVEDPRDFMYNFLYGFGYDNSTDDYFVVLIGLGQGFCLTLTVFSVKADSWHNEYGKYNLRYMFLLGLESHAGVFLNDSLHWLVISKVTKLLVILVLHLSDNSLSEIPVPPELAARDLSAPPPEVYYHLRVLGGCLSLCYSSGTHYRNELWSVVGDNRDGAGIWVMKEYKVQSSWTKAFVMTFCDIPCKHFYPICFVEGGGVVGSNGCGRLLKFNAKGELLEHRKYKQKQENVRNYFEVYRESLLLFPGEQPHNFKEAVEDEGATENEEEKASELSLCTVKSLPCDFKETTKDEEEETTEDEEEETTEDEEEESQ